LAEVGIAESRVPEAVFNEGLGHLGIGLYVSTMVPIARAELFGGKRRLKGEVEEIKVGAERCRRIR
jgi:hypothetical protein